VTSSSVTDDSETTVELMVWTSAAAAGGVQHAVMTVYLSVERHSFHSAVRCSLHVSHATLLASVLELA